MVRRIKEAICQVQFGFGSTAEFEIVAETPG